MGAESAVNITLQLLDLLLLLSYDSLHQIADRHHAVHPSALYHRQVPHAPLGHELHALLHRRLGLHGQHLRGHDVAHRSVGGGAAHEDDLAGIVALGNDAAEGVALHHQQRADVALRHHADRLENRRAGWDGENLPPLAVEQLTHADHQLSLPDEP